MPDCVCSPFAYLILRVVPRLERGESLNAGVVLFARTRQFLGARTALDAERLASLDRDADAAAIARHLEGIERVAGGDPHSGPLGQLPASERFNWVAAPSSTVVQPSPVHTGVCSDPAETLERLFERLVL